MKIVREHINEKFVEDSDPIKDLGIGVKLVYYHFDESASLISSDGLPVYCLKLIGYKINKEELLKLINGNSEAIFRWSSYLEGWGSISNHTKEYWLESAPKIFKYMERDPRCAIIPSGNTAFKIPGYK